MKSETATLNHHFQVPFLPIREVENNDIVVKETRSGGIPFSTSSVGKKSNHWLEKHNDNLIFSTASDIVLPKIPWF